MGGGQPVPGALAAPAWGTVRPYLGASRQALLLPGLCGKSATKFPRPKFPLLLTCVAMCPADCALLQHVRPQVLQHVHHTGALRVLPLHIQTPAFPHCPLACSWHISYALQQHEMLSATQLPPSRPAQPPETAPCALPTLYPLTHTPSSPLPAQELREYAKQHAAQDDTEAAQLGMQEMSQKFREKGAEIYAAAAAAREASLAAKST